MTAIDLADMDTTTTAVLTGIASPVNVDPRVVAGRKRLSILQAATVSAGLRGTRVLQAACEDELAGTRLADGTLRISPGLCDALIELMTHLWIDAVLGQEAGHAA